MLILVYFTKILLIHFLLLFLKDLNALAPSFERRFISAIYTRVFLVTFIWRSFTIEISYPFVIKIHTFLFFINVMHYFFCDDCTLFVWHCWFDISHWLFFPIICWLNLLLRLCLDIFKDMLKLFINRLVLRVSSSVFVNKVLTDSQLLSNVCGNWITFKLHSLM